MKLFTRREHSSKSADDGAVSTSLDVSGAAALPNAGDMSNQPPPLPDIPVISLTAEERTMLAQPIDPRVDRILDELRAIKAAEEFAPGSSRIIRFPTDDSGDGTQPPDIQTQLTDGI